MASVHAANGAQQGSTVLLVESPAKAKKLQQFLGSDYKVLASYGHVRDLPSRAGSVLPDKDFEMLWERMRAARPRLQDIAGAMKQAQTLILATDPDREGEAISWHVQEELAAAGALRGVKVQRITFTEVTQQAVQQALAAPRSVSHELVDAYLGRRALDYLYGFTLSPLLWRKLPGSKSAGRVQSVALRLVCEREAERDVFLRQEYWSVRCLLEAQPDQTFEAKLVQVDGKPLPKEGLDKEAAANAVKALKQLPLQVESVDQKDVSRSPAPPFMTSTLQQEAFNRLGFSPSSTMQAAQRLYEGPDSTGGEGLITYMRTDSLQVAASAIPDIRKTVEQLHGPSYLPDAPRTYKSKAKNAQEAHEAIRPTKPGRVPDQAQLPKDSQLAQLYSLIWARALASQMRSASLLQVTANVQGGGPEGCLLRTSATSVTFPGYLAVYPPCTSAGTPRAPTDSQDEDDLSRQDGAGQDSTDSKQTSEELQAVLLALRNQQPVKLLSITPKQHTTKPPPRYTEASLVKALEKLGIGRPSTYASILKVLQERGYVKKEGRALVPESRGRVLSAFLQHYFSDYVDYGFTATLEDQLDLVSAGQALWKEVLRDFWAKFEQAVNQTSGVRITEVINVLDPVIGQHFLPLKKGQSEEDARRCPACGGRLGLKLATSGGFIGCSNYPDCSYTRPLDLQALGEGGEEATHDEQDISLGVHPSTGREIRVLRGPYGWYLEMAPDDAQQPPEDASSNGASTGKRRGRPKAPKAPKPQRVSLGKLPAGQVPELTLEEAVELLQWPKELGLHPEDGEPVTAAMGTYGPYVRHQKLNASLPKDCDPKTVTLEQAVEMLKAKAAQKASRRAKAGESSSSTAPSIKGVSEDNSSASEGTDSAAPKERGRPRKSKAAASQPKDPDSKALPDNSSTKKQSRGAEESNGSKTKRGQARKSTKTGSAAGDGTSKKRGRPKKTE
ncbi:g512 [Coccomyxa viridis]|uniref:DNA topoisomerase n=1 Tax=Coccomyxa viridis TaxID=1274662 RepID=A0ABP1FJK2_9CHLO